MDEHYPSVKEEVRKELREVHTRGLNALPVIFPVSASLDLNSQIATAFKISLQKKLWKFLIADGDAEEHLVKTVPEMTKDADDSETYAFLLNPFVQTGLFVSECINLDFKPVGDKVKLVEKSGCFKDRFSAVSYTNFFVSTEFDNWLLKETESEDSYWDYMLAMTNLL